MASAKVGSVNKPAAAVATGLLSFLKKVSLVGDAGRGTQITYPAWVNVAPSSSMANISWRTGSGMDEML